MVYATHKLFQQKLVFQDTHVHLQMKQRRADRRAPRLLSARPFWIVARCRTTPTAPRSATVTLTPVWPVESWEAGLGFNQCLRQRLSDRGACTGGAMESVIIAAGHACVRARALQSVFRQSVLSPSTFSRRTLNYVHGAFV